MMMMRDDRGSTTAEFAVVLPAVLMVLALMLGSILLGAQRLMLTSAAAEVARLEARGDLAAAGARLGSLAFVSAVQRSREGPLHCVTLSASPGAGLLAAIQLSARGCAAAIEGAA